MGESTCLARSFSTPADTSCIALETNPMRMLGESISFGRFMSESLDWGRWSTFSHNRYVEEAEKYSKPGFVAAKKAFFEAHYKKTVAVKSATSIQEENTHVDGTSNSETQEGNCDDSMSEMKPKADNEVVDHAISYQAAEHADSDVICYQTINHADTDQYKCEIVQSELVISNMEGAGDVPHPHADANVNVGSHIDVEVHNKNTVNPVDRMPDHGTAGHEVLVSPVKETEVNSPKLSTKTRVSRNERKAAATLPPKIGISKKSVRDSVEKRRPTSQSVHISVNLPSGAGETRKTAASSVHSRNGINCLSKSKKSVGGSVEKKSLTARSLHMSVNLPSGTGERSKAVNAAVKPRNHASKSVKSVGESVQRQTARSLHKSINLPFITDETRKTALVFEHNRTKKVHSNLAGESVQKQTARPLHMSINLPSGTGETSKTTSLFEHNRTKKVHSNLDNISKDHPMASGTSTKADNVFSKQASDNYRSQGRRTERPLNKSVSGGVTANAKLSSISVGCLKSSSITKSNPQIPTKSSPYRFKSEERALKRKEFLPRMDETKHKEEEKVQLQRIHKEKTDHNDKKLRQSISSQPKLNGGRHDGSHRPSNHVIKISLTQPRSPKLGRKTSSSTVQDKNCGTSWKPPISTNNPKRISEKNNRTTKKSVTSLSSITRENASPNVQH